MEKLIINNLEFAKKQQEISGELNVAQLERLSDLLTSSALDQVSNIQYQLKGSAGAQQTPGLQLIVNASLSMLCQRCLEAMSVEVKLKHDYLISDVEPENIDENDDTDWLATEIAMDLQLLIEDEMLIALPIAPKHAEMCKPLKLESGEKMNPFALLKGKFK